MSSRLPIMSAAAGRAMRNVLDLTAADRVLVVTDPGHGRVRRGLPRRRTHAGLRLADGTFCPPTVVPLSALPTDLPPLLDGVDVVINAIVGDPAEVPFRLKWIAAIEGSGRHRLGHSPGIDADMMLGGALDVDYEAMAARATRLLAGLKRAATVRVTTPAGTDLTMNVRRRAFTHDLKATFSAGANLPCGEVYGAPVEDRRQRAAGGRRRFRRPGSAGRSGGDHRQRRARRGHRGRQRGRGRRRARFHGHRRAAPTASPNWAWA